MYRTASLHRYYRYLYPTVAGTNVFAADSVYDALRQSGRRLWWDADGNMSREYYRYRPSLGEEEHMERRLCHNEEGLMQGYWQETGDSHCGETVAAWYAYDAGGRRALKLASERAAGSGQSAVELCDPVYYVSPLVTLTRTGYSKHYFEGQRRICTVIGGGFGLVPWDSVTHDLMPVVGPHDDELAKVLQMGAESTFNDCIEVRAYLTNTLALYKMMQNESERYETHEPAFYYHTERCRSREQSHACMSYAETRQRVRSQHLGCTAKCFVYNVSQAKTLPESGYFLRFGSEVHWTSSSYGEDWVDDSKFTYTDTNHIGIYQFNGKERDFESGFYYYGARYHWPELLTGWTTPDPLMDKYPGISPYNYCNWNPVIFVDPDGRKWKETTDQKRANEIKENIQKRIHDIENSINDSNREIAKRSAKGKNIEKQKMKLSELQNQKRLLEDFSKGIDELNESDVIYTFNPTRGIYHKNSIYAFSGEVYSINYQMGNESNLVHETTHAIQADRLSLGIIDRPSDMQDWEVGAYSTQYSFDPQSLSTIMSDCSIIPSSRISKEWIRGIYFYEDGKKNYPYEKIH